MVGPIDYTMQVLDPIQGYMKGLAFGEDLKTAQLGREQTRQTMGIQAAQEARAAEEFQLRKAEAARKVAQAQRGQQVMADLQTMPHLTNEALDVAVKENPWLLEQIEALRARLTESQKASQLRTAQSVYAAVAQENIPVARRLLEENRDAFAASGDEQMLGLIDQGLKLFDTDPQSALRALRTGTGFLVYQSGGDIDKLNASLGIGGTEMRVQSSTNVGPGISVQTMTDGTTRVVDTTTNELLTGETARQAIEAAQAQIAAQRGAVEEAAGAGRLSARAELGAAATGAEAAGRTAIEIGREAFGRVNAIREQAGRLNEVVRLIDDGATTGVIAERLPDWNASTIELRNLQRELGLDVVGSVTFGALSESELALALQTGLPTQLSGPDLRNWAVRKKAAQDKLADYLERQAIFLSTPGNTLDMWLRQVQQERAPAGAIPQSFLDNESVRSAADRAGVTPQQMWSVMTEEQRARYGE